MVKKILIISDGFLPPGVKVAGIKNLYLIQKYLSKKNFLIHILVFVQQDTISKWNEWKNSEETKYNIRFHVISTPMKKIHLLHLFLTRLLSFFIALYLQIRNKFDLIHEYSSTPFFINRTYLLGLITNIKTVHTLCTINKSFLGSEKLLFKSTDKLICANKNMKEKLEKRVSTKINLIPIPIDDSFFHIPSNNSKKKFGIKTEKMVLFCGLLDHRKGISCFLEAIPEIIRLNSDTSIVILTAPGLNTFQSSRQNRKRVLFLIRHYGERVILIDEEVDMPSLFSAADVHIYPNLTMHGTLASPSILIEGMATGKAIVASCLPEIASIIKDGKNGLLFKPGDSQELVRAVNELLRNQKLRQCLGEQAKLDSQKYRLSVICKKIMNLYKELEAKEIA